MAASSAGVGGRGRADRRRRWWSWAGVMVSAGADEGDEGRRLRTDQVGFSRMEAAVDFELEFVVKVRVVAEFIDRVVMARRRARRQDEQSAIGINCGPIVEYIYGLLQCRKLIRVVARD